MSTLSRGRLHIPDNYMLKPNQPIVLDFTPSGPSVPFGNGNYISITPPIDPQTGENFKVVTVSTPNLSAGCFVSVGNNMADNSQSGTPGIYTMNSMFIPSNSYQMIKIDEDDTVISVSVAVLSSVEYVCIGGCE